MLIESARILLRRWLWVLIALVVALAAAVGAYAVTKPVQETNANVLFVPPSTDPSTNKPVNPFYSLGGSTITMTVVVQTLVSDDKVANQLTADGLTAKYEVNPNLAQNAGPSLLVKVTDPSAANSMNTLKAILKQIDSNLVTIQKSQGVPSSLYIQDIALTQSAKPVAMHKVQIQLAVIALVVILFLLSIVIILFERRRTPRLAAGPDYGEPETDVPASRTRRTESAAPAERGRPGARRGDRKTRVSPSGHSTIRGRNRRIGRDDYQSLDAPSSSDRNF